MPAEIPEVVNVAVGVIVQGMQNSQTAHKHEPLQFFVCRRQAHQHQGNKWEFPGGKIETNESAEQALIRELNEEVGIQVLSSTPLTNIEFKYPDKHVKLHVRMVVDFSGNAHGAEGQESQWVDFHTLSSLDFPKANVKIIKALHALLKA